MADTVRVRMAPSPTGRLHVGSAHTALFNYLFARHHGGTFILRIEDTDMTRNTAESLQSIFDGLRWLGLDWDEGPEDAGVRAREGETYQDYLQRVLANGERGEAGPYFQTQRLPLYEEHARKLLESGKAYRCYCTPEELEQSREEQKARGVKAPKYSGRCRQLSAEQEAAFVAEGRKPCLRLRVSDEGVTAFDDLVRGRIEFENKEIDDLILLKSNGYPTYHFGVVVDDALMRITHVIRGEEHISNTPPQILMYEALGFPVPQFAHLPLLLGRDRKKLSKRHGATEIFAYRDKGVLPEAMFNFLALIGWSPGEGETQEIFTREELIQRFSLAHVSKASGIFDLEKLEWMNATYIRQMDLEQLLDACLPYLQQAGLLPLSPVNSLSHEPMNPLTRAYALRVLALTRERMRYLPDVVEQTNYFFTDDFPRDAKAVAKWLSDAETQERLKVLRDRLSQVGAWTITTLENVVRQYADEIGQPAARLIHPLRVACTGRTVGPGLFETMAVLGRERCLKRLSA
ncbi:MAG: glutamate--tRNA ligase [Abditibacteriales bacterium]|nr:glutamate--tRNA ligase [Abditibacteriales bacterium]MDW8368451.1 glutamate--tRNA ligase [Abditibacteriales bacterium]